LEVQPVILYFNF